MYLAFFDGLDALIEYYIPLARDYPIAPFIYLLALALPVLALIFLFRAWGKKKSQCLAAVMSGLMAEDRSRIRAEGAI